MVKIIVNPVAGFGRTLALWQNINRQIQNLGIEYTYEFSQGVGYATKLAREAVRDGFREIFVVGGDGTLNEVINGIDLNQTAVGIIPTGSGNDLAKMLGIKSIQEGLSSLKRQNRRRIDLGRALGRLFVNNLGIGFDALVASYQKKFKIFKGSLGYLVSVLRVLYNFRSYEVEITLDQYRFCERIMSVSIGNGQFHGGCFKLTPLAVIDDEVLDICIISKICKLKFLFNIPRAITGTHNHLKETNFFRSKGISLTSEAPLFVHFDGEVYSEPVKNIKVGVLPRSLELFT